MRIGVYGGTFDPPHMGHLTAAVAAARLLGLEKLIFIPAGIPPHKELANQTPDAQHRLAMVRLMAEQAAVETKIDVSVSTVEIEREGRSYTVDTLRGLRGEYQSDELWLLMGTDMFLTFQNWRAPEEILSMCGICAFGRSESDTEELFAVQRQYLAQRFPNARITTLTLPNVVEVSSTQLRAELSANGIARELLPTVQGYILRAGLYGTECDLKQLPLEKLRPAALSFLHAKRVPHVLGTEETAVKLAERYGADVEQARVAALLHDCTKRLSMEDQLALCELYGIELDELERETAKLLHAKTGAVLARDLFGVNDAVYAAISWHTTGKAGMTTLEKVLYLADYIEPTRDFEGVERLREAVWRDLDEGLLLGLTMTVEEMRGKGYVIHPNTLGAIESLRG
ncbi:MAG: nicotinate (nicotinamide) nucleotide adenylyltransferase [Oscillospiraceae bacterium]|nr:nicotinate (nicotinamide) nucleotide adenylyltransferase [Oscillospiraceae bacterium]